jgi:hypothetical protein
MKVKTLYHLSHIILIIQGAAAHRDLNCRRLFRRNRNNCHQQIYFIPQAVLDHFRTIKNALKCIFNTPYVRMHEQISETTVIYIFYDNCSSIKHFNLKILNSCSACVNSRDNNTLKCKNVIL